MSTGLATFYASNGSVPGTAKGIVYSSILRNSTTRAGIRYIRADVFVALFPHAMCVTGLTTTLSANELNELP